MKLTLYSLRHLKSARLKKYQLAFRDVWSKQVFASRVEKNQIVSDDVI